LCFCAHEYVSSSQKQHCIAETTGLKIGLSIYRLKLGLASVGSMIRSRLGAMQSVKDGAGCHRKAEDKDARDDADSAQGWGTFSDQ
jgi:hypothetical protein